MTDKQADAGADDLPPLPTAIGQIRTDLERSNVVWFGPLPPHETNLHTAEQVEQIRRDAILADRRARHPAGVCGIPTWQERYEEDGHERSGEEYMQDEIADLRAALSRQSSAAPANVLDALREARQFIKHNLVAQAKVDAAIDALADAPQASTGCSKCGSTGIHACPGAPIPAWTPEKIAEFNRILDEYESEPVEQPTKGED